MTTPISKVNALLIDASSGDTSAQIDLGTLYVKGEGVAKDNNQAIRWYKVAADSGSVVAMYNLGVVYDLVNDHEKSEHWYKAAASKGYASAQYRLGLRYDIFANQKRGNDTLAIHWYSLAADQNLVEAQYMLAHMYENGYDTSNTVIDFDIWIEKFAAGKFSPTVDYKRAVYYYKKAVDQGHAKAEFNLGIMFSTGRGVQVDQNEAVRLYRLSADHGYEPATKQLEKLTGKSKQPKSGGGMGLFSMVKEAIGCRLDLANLLAQSDVAFNNLTGLNPLSLHKDIRHEMKRICTELWKAYDLEEYPCKVTDFTFIKVGVMCSFARHANDENVYNIFSKALYKISEASWHEIKPEIYEYVKKMSGSQLYV